MSIPANSSSSLPLTNIRNREETRTLDEQHLELTSRIRYIVGRILENSVVLDNYYLFGCCLCPKQTQESPETQISNILDSLTTNILLLKQKIEEQNAFIAVLENTNHDIRKNSLQTISGTLAEISSIRDENLHESFRIIKKSSNNFLDILNQNFQRKIEMEEETNQLLQNQQPLTNSLSRSLIDSTDELISIEFNKSRYWDLFCCLVPKNPRVAITPLVEIQTISSLAEDTSSLLKVQTQKTQALVAQIEQNSRSIEELMSQITPTFKASLENLSSLDYQSSDKSLEEIQISFTHASNSLLALFSEGSETISSSLKVELPSLEEALVTLKGKKILIVDDGLTVLKVMERLLLRPPSSMAVKTASDGQKAVDLITRNLENPDCEGCGFDLVLMDIQMPNMNGLEATRRIRGHRELELLPILALSGENPEFAMIEAKAAGMNAFLSKPQTDIKVLFPHMAHLINNPGIQLFTDSTDSPDIGLNIACRYPQLSNKYLNSRRA